MAKASGRPCDGPLMFPGGAANAATAHGTHPLLAGTRRGAEGLGMTQHGPTAKMYGGCHDYDPPDGGMDAATGGSAGIPIGGGGMKPTTGD